MSFHRVLFLFNFKHTFTDHLDATVDGMPVRLAGNTELEGVANTFVSRVKSQRDLDTFWNRTVGSKMQFNKDQFKKLPIGT